ncbi:MAG: GAF domain-containing protein [Aquihabitans sp.]
MESEPIEIVRMRQLLDAVMSVASDLELDVVLKRVVTVAVELVDARYGALGVLDPDRTHLSDFIHVGMDDALVAEIGELPKGHGILGLLITDPDPVRLADLNVHPDSFGFPAGHPPMGSFLGVPIFVGGTAWGNLYLTDKRGGEQFNDLDEKVALGLAAAAGVAIEKARLHARVRELDVIADRDRIARDLHDTVIQRLFATGLSLEGALRLATAPEVAYRLTQAVDDIDNAIVDVRASIFELQTRPATIQGTRRHLLVVGDEVTAALGFSPSFHFVGPVDDQGAEVDSDLVAVVREALSNAARYAEATAVSVTIEAAPTGLTVTVQDNGVGPLEERDGGQGLRNLRRRAERLGGTSALEPVDEGGSRLWWWIPIQPTPATYGSQ